MDSIQTHQELLITLAASGDPTAFYTLISQYANAAYIAERNSGKNHKESLSVLIPFIKAAYQDFIKTSPHKAFDIWYRDFKKKYFSNADNSSTLENSCDHVEIGNIPMTDITHFDRILDLILQRKYGKIKRTRKNQSSIQIRRFRLALRTSAIIAALGIIFIAFNYFLATTHRQFSMIYSFKGSSMTLTLPFSSNTSTDKITMTQNSFIRHGISEIDSLQLHSQTIHDTVILHDTIRAASRLNLYHQQKKPSVISQGTGTQGVATQSIATQGIGTQTTSIQANKPPAPAVTTATPPSIQGTVKTSYDSLQQK
jgi:hypothetical protein